MRNPVWLAVLAAAAILAGCGTAHVGQRAAPTTDPAPSTHSAPVADVSPHERPKQRAAADAAHILAVFIAPPHAVRTGRSSVSWLAQPPSFPLSPDLVTRTGWWRVAGQPQAVLRWIQAHKPAGFSDSGGGTSGVVPPGGPPTPPAGPPHISGRAWYAEFSLPDVPGVLVNRVLIAEVAAAGPHQTAIRVDAEVIWLPVKPAAEHIPAAAHIVTITPISGDRRPAAADHQVTITDPGQTARIAAAVNALPLDTPVDWMECGPGPGPGMRLTFRATATSPALAVVTAYQELCPVVQVVTGGKNMPVLDGAETLFQRVMAIAGFHWKDFPAPGPTATPD
jgi:hypothetical protein